MKYKQKTLKVGSKYIYSYFNSDGIGWVRISGFGIHWKDTRRHRLYFSERNRYRKGLTIFGYRLSLLKP